MLVYTIVHDTTDFRIIDNECCEKTVFVGFDLNKIFSHLVDNLLPNESEILHIPYNKDEITIMDLYCSVVVSKYNSSFDVLAFDTDTGLEVTDNDKLHSDFVEFLESRNIMIKYSS